MRELLAMNRGDLGPTALAYGELLMGAVSYHRGHLVDSVEHVQQSIASAPAGLMLGPIDFHSNALTILAAALWQVGRLDDGLSRALEAVEHARRGVAPFNLVTSLMPLAAVYHWCGDAVDALQAARELAAHSREQGITETVACSELTEAWVLHMGGEREKALDKVKLGIAALRQHGSMMQSVYLLTVAVEVLVASGRAAEAADLLDEAKGMIEDGAARWWEPEIYRWQAVLLGLDDGADVDEAESNLLRACELAAQQGSNSLHLRAALPLADLWLQRGRDRDAKEFVVAALRDVHGGVDTHDVRVARAWVGLPEG